MGMLSKIGKAVSKVSKIGQKVAPVTKVDNKVANKKYDLIARAKAQRDADKNVQKVNNKVLTSAQKAAQIAKMKKTEAQQQALAPIPVDNETRDLQTSTLAGRGPVGPAPAGMTSLNATPSMKKGGKTKCMAKGGGIEVRGKTRGRFI